MNWYYYIWIVIVMLCYIIFFFCLYYKIEYECNKIETIKFKFRCKWFKFNYKIINFDVNGGLNLIIFI